MKIRDAQASPAITPDKAIAIAQIRFPDAEFDHLHPPTGPTGIYEVAFRQPDEIQQSFGRTQVFLNQYTGEVLMVRAPETFTAADAFIARQFPLHNGEAFGLVGRWIVFVTGVPLAAIYVTGVMVSWRRRRKQRMPPRGQVLFQGELASASEELELTKSC